MKNFTTYFRGFLITTTVLLSACVNDDSIFPDTDENDITNSTSLVTVLRSLTSGPEAIPESELCFKFEYPIVLGYNTNSNIRLDNYDGLIDVVSSQSANFNISAVVFPIEIKFNKNDSIASINNESDFIKNIELCDINTFREDFNTSFRKCVKFDYPVTLINDTKEEIIIANDDEFDVFYQNQEFDYQPNFKFPINILAAPEFLSTRVATYFEFYQLISDCINCPDVRFDIEPVSDTAFQIIPDFEIKDRYELFFSINGDTIADVIIDGRPFVREFTAPGAYELCIKIITPDCPEGTKVCKEVIVEEICPNLMFEGMQEPDTFSYNFIAEFPEISEVTYNWIVDEQVVEENDGGANGDNRFIFQFTPGVHKVCIATETPFCPSGIEFCEEIIVCPEPFFIAEQQGVTSTYDFTADFLGITDITYEWTINGEPQETDGGTGGDNIFTFQFDQGTSYEICIVTEVQGCSNTTKYCVNIDIP